MTLGEMTRLERLAQNSKDEEVAKEAMKKLRVWNSTYHWCPDWDEAVISNRHNEWQCCTCDIKLKAKGNGES